MTWLLCFLVDLFCFIFIFDYFYQYFYLLILLSHPITMPRLLINYIIVLVNKWEEKVSV